MWSRCEEPEVNAMTEIRKTREDRDKDVICYVRFSQGVIDRIDDIAREEESTRSNVIRRVVIKALRNREE
jgi:hypothetical protein